MNNIKLSDHFTYKKLLRFTLPTIAMMIFTSIYDVVDGFFISNFVGETAFASLNLIYPFVMIFSVVGLMLGVGGSALVAFTIGTGDEKKARELFSMFVYLSIAMGIVFTIIGFIFAEPVARFLGANEEMLPYCVLYGKICFVGITPLILQIMFHSFFVTAQKPRLGFFITVGAGLTNMFLDWLFVVVLKLGLAGAAWASVTSMIVGGVLPVIYFLLPNSSLLRLGKTKFYPRELRKAATNGSSEFVSNISLSFVGMLYNFQLMKYVGQAGVAAYGVVTYTNFIFLGCFIGYSIGMIPVIGYNYGSKNKKELENVFKRSMKLIMISSVFMAAISMFAAKFLAGIFVSNNPALLTMTTKAIRIYSISYLFSGINLFGSSFFTGLNNGKVSALISFMRVLVLQVFFVLILPMLFSVNGIWMSIIMAELCAMIITISCLVKYRDKYGYA